MIAELPSIRAILSRFSHKPVEQIEASMALGIDFGLDSLGVVELLAAMEQGHGILVDESRVSLETTVAQLEELAAQKGDPTPSLAELEWPLKWYVRLARDAALSLIVLPLLRLWVSKKVEGREHLHRIQCPVVFAPNHLSMIDTALILGSLPRRWRRYTAAAAAAHLLLNRGLITFLLATFLFNAFPFAQSGLIRASIRRCGSLIDRGWSIVFYPEGRRSDTGHMGSFRPGIGMIAVSLGAPVVPVRISGTYEVMSKGRLIPHRGQVRVSFGEPMKFSPGTHYLEAARAIERAVRDLGTGP